MIYCAFFISTENAINQLVKKNLKNGIFIDPNNSPGTWEINFHVFKKVGAKKFRVRTFERLQYAVDFLLGKEAENELQSRIS